MCKEKRMFDPTIELADNAMLKHRPDLFDEWDFEKNDEMGLDVYKVTASSNRKAFWICNKGHRWNTVISVRAGKQRKPSGCPYCAGKRADDFNSVYTLYPELASQWHPTKNGNKTPKDFTAGSGQVAWWKCECGYEWKARISSRTRQGNGCPNCSGKIIGEHNNLAVLRPDLLETWNHEKNTVSPYEVGTGYNKKVWWTCEKCESDYECSVGNRCVGKACSYCHGRKVNDTNSLGSKRPDLIIEWVDVKNNELGLTPYTVTVSSHTKVWWKCLKCNNNYECSLANKAKGKSCPYCSNQKILVGFNDMWTTNPELAESLFNSSDGFIYTEGSNKKVRWKCSKCNEDAGIKSISKVKERGVKCRECSDSMSMGERLMNNLFAYKKIKFKQEKTFEWSMNKRYDFYLPDYNTIVEVHGQQHYSGAGFSKVGGRTVEEEKENDKIKEELAYNNGIKNYIVINASVSECKFIESSIKESNLLRLLGINEESVNWRYLRSISKKRKSLV